MSEVQPNYIFLDDAADRKKFLTQVHAVRRSVLDIVEYVPESQWYEPRYHDWSLAAMLGHLNLRDNMGMLALKAALLGMPLRVSPTGMDRINSFTARMFKNRVLDSSTVSMKKNEKRIEEFLMPLPVSQFSTQIYSPDLKQFTTVERAIQDFFLFHWQQHLETMQIVEGIHTDNA